MTLFDFFLIVILFGAGVLGYKRGVIVQIASLFATFLSLFIALLLADDLAPKVAEWFGSKDPDHWMDLSPLNKAMYSILAFFFLFLVTKIFLSFITFLFYRLARFSFLKRINRLGGIFLSLLQTIILFIFVVHMMNIVPFKKHSGPSQRFHYRTAVDPADSFPDEYDEETVD